MHEHLPFGEGEMDVPPVLAALRASGYAGLVTVELPRDSHAGPDRAHAAAALPAGARKRPSRPATSATEAHPGGAAPC